MADIFYNPEHFGLEIVASVDADDGWGFDILCVWKDETGNFYYAIDTGCSCPSPFEDYTSKSDLHTAVLPEVIEIVRQKQRAEWTDLGAFEVNDFIRKIREAWAKEKMRQQGLSHMVVAGGRLVTLE